MGTEFDVIAGTKVADFVQQQPQVVSKRGRFRIAADRITVMPFCLAKKTPGDAVLRQFPVSGEPGQGHRDAIPGNGGDGREQIRDGSLAAHHGLLGLDASSMTSSSCARSTTSKPRI